MDNIRLDSDMDRGVVDLLFKMLKQSLQGCTVDACPDEQALSRVLPLLQLPSIRTVRPILYPLLNAILPQSLKDNNPDFEEVGKDYYYRSQRNAELWREFCCVAQECAKRNIPLIALKGICVKDLYGDSMVRSMGDVDFLIRKKDFNAVEDVLFGMGYAYIHARHVQIHKDYYCHVAYKKDKLSMEIHWLLVLPSCPFRFDHEGIWKRAVPWDKVNGNALVMDDVDLFLHLCAHIVKHAYTELDPEEKAFEIPLRAYCDIALILLKYDLDWTEIQRRAETCRIWNSVLFASCVAAKLFDICLPQPVKAESYRRLGWLLSRLAQSRVECLQLACNLPDSFIVKALFWETLDNKLRLFRRSFPLAIAVRRLRPHVLRWAAIDNTFGRFSAKTLSLYRIIKKGVCG